MSHTSPTYVVFDGDNDKWAYAYMKGWKENENVDFDFFDAHDLDTMTNQAQGEAYVKTHLRERMKKSSSVVVLIGDNTKNLYKFVRWELDLAIDLDKPIVGVNLSDLRKIDNEKCPPVLRDKCVIHIPFKMAIIKFSLDNWPSGYAGLSTTEKTAGARYYNDETYRKLGI